MKVAVILLEMFKCEKVEKASVILDEVSDHREAVLLRHLAHATRDEWNLWIGVVKYSDLGKERFAVLGKVLRSWVGNFADAALRRWRGRRELINWEVAEHLQNLVLMGSLQMGQKVYVALERLITRFTERTSRAAFSKETQRSQKRWTMAQVVEEFHQVFLLWRPAALEIDVAVAHLAESVGGRSQGVLVRELSLVLLHDVGEHLDQAGELVLCHRAYSTSKTSRKLLKPPTRSSETELLANSTSSEGSVGLHGPAEVEVETANQVVGQPLHRAKVLVALHALKLTTVNVSLTFCRRHHG